MFKDHQVHEADVSLLEILRAIERDEDAARAAECPPQGAGGWTSSWAARTGPTMTAPTKASRSNRAIMGVRAERNLILTEGPARFGVVGL